MTCAILAQFLLIFNLQPDENYFWIVLHFYVVFEIFTLSVPFSFETSTQQ